MVKRGGELPAGDAVGVKHTTQLLSSPEWKFQAIARSKTKRYGTPHPEKVRQALKRAGLESGSEVSRAKKRMVFEMADCLFTKRHGEDEQALIGEMLSSLAQMAKDGSAPACGRDRTDGEGVAGMSPAPAGRSHEDPRLECELVNKVDIASTTSHVKRLGEGLACDGLDACDSHKEKEKRLLYMGKNMMVHMWKIAF